MTDLTELRRLLEEATPGPWSTERMDRDEEAVHTIETKDALVVQQLGCACCDYGLAVKYADADLIVAAVNALPQLLDAAEALERVKELHHPTPAPTSMHYRCEPSECDQAGDGELRDECDNCREWYPCSTIRAAGGAS